MELLLLFIALNIANVVLQTVKSICTVKCNKWVASLVNAVAYALYTYVIVYTTIDGIELWEKALIVGLANLIGVFVVKLIEEKSRKEQLWRVEATIKKEKFCENFDMFKYMTVPHNYIDIDKYVIVNFYCSTCKQSEIVKELLNDIDAKYFVSESKIL